MQHSCKSSKNKRRREILLEVELKKGISRKKKCPMLARNCPNKANHNVRSHRVLKVVSLRDPKTMCSHAGIILWKKENCVCRSVGKKRKTCHPDRRNDISLWLPVNLSLSIQPATLRRSGLHLGVSPWQRMGARGGGMNHHYS